MKLTVDSMMLQPEAYKTKMHEYVFRLGPDIYAEILFGESTLLHGFVRRGEFVELTYAAVYVDIRDQLVAEAMERKDYLLFGMSREDFQTKSYDGTIEDLAINPYIHYRSFEEAIELFIGLSQLTFIDEVGDVINSPLQEVW